MKSVEIGIRADAPASRAMASQLLEANKFRLTWHDEWTATAERGSKVGNALGGAFAQYFKVGLRVLSGGEGEMIIRFEQQSSGWMGGALGARRTTKNMEWLRDNMSSWLQQQGMFLWVREDT